MERKASHQPQPRDNGVNMFGALLGQLTNQRPPPNDEAKKPAAIYNRGTFNPFAGQ